MPLTKSRFLGAKATIPAPGVVDCTWRYEDGWLRFVANVGDDEYAADAEGGQVIWSNGASRQAMQLPSWTGVFLIGGSK
ncbi:hypothetical protein GCM10025880_58150 [Methylorubrum aminovorans]|nr:hypothetical protein GCM10025880_58150 [Methylorubrum aminovorans]